MAADSSIIIYDEPTSGLDYVHMSEVADNIKKLKKIGRTQIVVTHDPELILKCCDHVVCLKDAPIIILDEATANVDPENEKELMSAIEELTREKTIFMIAHRLKTVRNADKICVIDKGEIVQQGNHDELMAVDGIYRDFVETRNRAVSWKL